MSAVSLHPDIDSVLWSSEVLQQRVCELGKLLAHDFQDKCPLLLVTLAGAFVFAADLVRHMDPTPPGLQVDFIRASSYGAGTSSSGEVRVQEVSKICCNGRHVIIVEDIVDTGHTLKRLIDRVGSMGASSVTTVTLLSKEARREVDVIIGYSGFECPDAFIVGYGLDYNENYRTLPYIGVLKEAVISPS